ncbi:transcription factor TFIIIC subunit tfc4, partial [Nowakowskiella sp. JEL0078]
MAFGCSASLKYFKRVSEIGEQSKKQDSRVSPVLYSTLGGTFEVARTHRGAISAYLRAYNKAPDDPMINLALGIAHIHRAMQRQTENRHLQVVQGFTFLFRYRDLRSYNLESSFNIARAFHHIGLSHLAIPFYEEVLGLHVTDGRRKMSVIGLPEEEQSLKREAAYNLSMFYMSVGSTFLAEKLLRDYCT